jgi:DNA-binding NtrC family response regulator
MARDGRKSKVLVVDDERNVLLTYKMLLEQQGYETIASLTAKEAIGLIEKQDFDLLLCDLSLEEKRTGFEVIQAARSRSRTVPAVLLTGYASPEAADYAKENDVSVLYKPIEIDEFLKTIATLLKEQHA